jgi:hypothetical protein
MNETWSHWVPRNGLERRYNIKSILDGNKGLILLLSPECKEAHDIQITFGYSASAHRTTYETFRHALIIYLHQKYGSDFYTKWTFFKVENSLYMQWLREQSEGMSDFEHYQHFAILTPDLFVDILAMKEPEISELDTKE